MDGSEKQQRKLQKQKAKAWEKRYKKINNGLDLCLIAFCFLICLIAAILQNLRENAE